MYEDVCQRVADMYGEDRNAVEEDIKEALKASFESGKLGDVLPDGDYSDVGKVMLCICVRAYLDCLCENADMQDRVQDSYLYA